MRFLDTLDGWVSSRFVIRIDSNPTVSEDGSTAWHIVEYQAGAELRETYATPDDVSQFLALS
jgi:hypothetical protein